MNETITTETTSASNGHLVGRLLSASTLSGDDVYNLQGDKLGNIKELMLDIENGQVCYAVLSFGGFLSLGEKLFAVPWNALTIDTDRKCMVIDADEARLKNAPGFDADNWPNMADSTWGKGVHDFYGTSH